MKIVCIDPGTFQSGLVVINENRSVLWNSIFPNEEILQYNHLGECDVSVIEMVASYGKPVGKSVFDTVVWIGKFVNHFEKKGIKVVLQTRKETIRVISSWNATDSNVRQALIDRYPLTGGGATPQIGTKNEPGPLYGISKHMWPALALGHAYLDGCKEYELYTGS